MARFHMPRFQNQNAAFDDPQKMPFATRDYLKISFNRRGAQAIQKGTGIKGSQGFKILNDLADRLLLNDDGTWRLPSVLTHAEASLLNCVCSTMISRPAFEADGLCEDFFATLKSNSLIMKDELAQHKESLGVLVKLYAISVMHNCIVQVGDGTTTQLLARADQKANTISILAGVPDGRATLPNLTLASPMFYMDADPADHCHSELLDNPEWDFEIELNENRQLARLS
jgi:hypothetical protein